MKAIPVPAVSPDNTTARAMTFGLFDTVLGPMLIAGTSLGVCHVAFGVDPGALEHSLRAEFPRAAIARNEQAMQAPAGDISTLLTGSARHVGVTLDVAGTPFQQRVWEELRHIPFGERRSYQELAAAVGRPTAARAVAGACARNHLAVVIPCHRVVRSSGALGGYRWGIERKRKLLDAERALSR